MTRKPSKELVEQMVTAPHSLTVEFSEVDGEAGWVARIPELPGCMNVSQSIEEAVGGLRGAKEAWIEARIAHGQNVPPPKASRHSGRFVVRMSASLHRRAVDLAKIEGQSLNQFVVEAVAKAVGQREGQPYAGFDVLMRYATRSAPPKVVKQDDDTGWTARMAEQITEKEYHG